MLMLPLMSFGAVYALIPVIIILILIAAAAGLNRGASLFELLGFGTLIGSVRGIGGGTAGGQGIRRVPTYRRATVTGYSAGRDIGGALFGGGVKTGKGSGKPSAQPNVNQSGGGGTSTGGSSTAIPPPSPLRRSGGGAGGVSKRVNLSFFGTGEIKEQERLARLRGARAQRTPTLKWPRWMPPSKWQGKELKTGFGKVTVTKSVDRGEWKEKERTQTFQDLKKTPLRQGKKGWGGYWSAAKTIASGYARFYRTYYNPKVGFDPKAGYRFSDFGKSYYEQFGVQVATSRRDKRRPAQGIEPESLDEGAYNWKRWFRRFGSKFKKPW